MKQKPRKILSVLLALIMMVSLTAFATLTASAEPETLAEWIATSTMGTAATHTATTGTGTLSQSRNSSIAWSSSAYGAQDANAWLWSTEGGYWQLSGISTTGYTQLSIKLNARSSGTGPRDFKVYYSADGTTYLPATSSEVDYTAGNAAWNNNNIVAIPTGADDCAALTIRLVNATNISARAGTGTYSATEAIAGGGTSQVQNVTITGSAIGSGDNNVATPTANPPGGSTVSDGATVTLSTATADASIFYTLDGATPTEASTLYSGPITLSFGAQSSVTIKAIAVKAGLDNSNVATFTYSKTAPTSISSARAQIPSSGNGPTVTVTGVVTYRYNTTGLHIQDGTGENDGIYVYIPGASLVAADWVGKEITVTGFLLYYNGLPEIQTTLADITTNGVGAFTYKTVTLAEIADGKYKCMAVKVEDVQLTARNAATTLQNHTISRDGASVILRTALPSSFAQDDWITINKGYVYVYQNAAQIMCDDVPDIVPGTEPPPIETPDIDGSGTIAQWNISGITGSVTSINATGGDFMPISSLQFIKNVSGVATPQSLNFSSGGANLSGLNGSANNAWWLVELSSQGFANIEVSWNMRSSATGPRDFKLQYSVDGVNWVDANNPSVVVPSALAIGNTEYTKTLPAGADNQTSLYLRWLMTSETAANGGVIGSGGTHQINYINVNGDYILLANQLHRPLVDTGSGAVPVGKVIAFTPGSVDDADAPGYAVLISADNGATWNAAVGNQYTIASLPLTLIVKAIATGKTDSRETTYEYTHAKLPMVSASRNSGAVIPGATIRLENEFPEATIKYTINGGAAQTYTEALTLEEALFVGDPAKLTIEAWAEGPGYLTGDSTTFIYTVAVTGGERVYFGQLHSHTTNSDGIGSLVEAFDYAKNVAALDFFAVTDHSNSFDETGANSDNPANINLDTYNVGSAKWQAGIAAANDARTADFISVYGYEMTWSGGPGHMNTFNTGGFVSRNNAILNGKANDSGMRAYYELLTRMPNSISMFNHPGTTFGNFNNFGYYDPVLDQRVTLVEVGNGEGEIGSGGYFRSYEQYTLALDKGWHLAPTNDQDNHLGKWGNSNTARTAIWTNDLSVEGLYQALRDMRVYATEVADLEIVYKVNGQPLGTIIDVVPQTANFTAEIKNPTAGNSIKSVALITNGGVEILRDTPDTQNYDYNKTITSPAAGYYYLRVVVATPQGDRYAVTAPVWLGQGKAAGFVEVTKSSVMPVTGESLTLTASLFNNESKPATLMSLEFKERTGGVLGSFTDLNLAIDPAGEVSRSLTYIPTAEGNAAVTVTAVVKFADDSELSYTYDISYEIWDADKLVYIGVDASHYNEYVDGNYKDNMANFTEIAAEYGVRVNILWTSQELIDACANVKYQAMILTAPSRRVDPAAMNPTTGQIYGAHRSYSQSELNALAQFAQRGGVAVLTGWSNVYENYNYNSGMALDEHMASQQNKVLSALGSTLRLSDDAATDPLQWSSATDPYRLYLTDTYGSYNWASPLLKGVDVSQIFSQYGGSTIYTVAASDKGVWNAAPSASIPETVIPAVTLSESGASENRETATIGVGNTNYRTDYTKYGGKFMALASEIVDHGNGVTSQVIAAGGAFMSNFEVKIEMENAATLQYSNYNIALNLIAAVAPEPEVTDIAVAKTLPEDTRVVIEGIATSNVYSGNSEINTGFFDCIYVQDDTGGINIFPVSSGVIEGQKIRVTGTLSAYQGETQIAVTKVDVLDASINSVAPETMTTQTAMAPENTGSLIKIEGIVSDVINTGGMISQFTVTDSSGVGALVFINAYITNTVDLSFVKDGAKVSVTGLASVGENNSSSDHLPRIRVRDRNEITLISQVVTSVKIDAPAQVTVLRMSKYTFPITLNPGATSEGIVWSVVPSGLASVNAATGEVITQNKTGTVMLTATDTASGLSSSIVLRII